MQHIAFTRALQYQAHLTKEENQRWKNYNAPIAFAAGGGLFFILLGFFLQIIFAVSDGDNTALNYAGAGSLITAFIFFAVGAHLMDKSDENERQYRRRAVLDNFR